MNQVKNDTGLLAMLHIKAANIISSREFFKARYGSGAVGQAMKDLLPEDRDYVEGLIGPSGWTPMDLWIRYHRTMLQRLAGGQESVQVEVGAHNAERDLKGVHRVFLKLGSPHFIIRMAQPLFNSYFRRDEGKLEINMDKLGVKHYQCTMVGFEPDHHLLELGVQGWLGKALEVSGARRVACELTGSVTSGTGRTIYRLEWD